MPQAEDDVIQEMPFPEKGLNVMTPLSEQLPLTTPVGNNVRLTDMLETRERGGSRCGLFKYIPAQINSGLTPIQDLNVVVDIDEENIEGPDEEDQDWKSISFPGTYVFCKQCPGDPDYDVSEPIAVDENGNLNEGIFFSPNKVNFAALSVPIDLPACTHVCSYFPPNKFPWMPPTPGIPGSGSNPPFNPNNDFFPLLPKPGKPKPFGFPKPNTQGWTVLNQVLPYKKPPAKPWKWPPGGNKPKSKTKRAFLLDVFMDKFVMTDCAMGDGYSPDPDDPVFPPIPLFILPNAVCPSGFDWGFEAFGCVPQTGFTGPSGPSSINGGSTVTIYINGNKVFNHFYQVDKPINPKRVLISSKTSLVKETGDLALGGVPEKYSAFPEPIFNENKSSVIKVVHDNQEKAQGNCAVYLNVRITLKVRRIRKQQGGNANSVLLDSFEFLRKTGNDPGATQTFNTTFKLFV